jgi:hypothetical protein
MIRTLDPSLEKLRAVRNNKEAVDTILLIDFNLQPTSDVVLRWRIRRLYEVLDRNLGPDDRLAAIGGIICGERKPPAFL